MEEVKMIEFEVIITNGYVGSDTIYNMTNKGWAFVATLPAKSIHPHAMETDKATIFSKYKEPNINATENAGIAL